MTTSHAGVSNVHLVHHGSEGVVTAEICLTGAALDDLVVRGCELIQKWDRSQARPFSSGLVLAPWPNRVRDGKWSDGEHDQQLEITEPGRGNAIHGLVTDTVFGLVDRTDSSAMLTATISPVPGYPYSLSLSVTYALNDRGITCQMLLKNNGESAAPVALGAHPYLCLGDVPVRSLSICAPVVSHLVVDEQMIPIGEEPVAASAFDISRLTSLANLQLDKGFRLGGEESFVTTLAAPDGTSVSLKQGPQFGWLQVFVTDEFPGPDGFTSAVAIEPMSAPADALNSGVNIIWLQPKDQWGGSWGITLNN